MLYIDTWHWISTLPSLSSCEVYGLVGQKQLISLIRIIGKKGFYGSLNDREMVWTSLISTNHPSLFCPSCPILLFSENQCCTPWTLLSLFLLLTPFSPMSWPALDNKLILGLHLHSQANILYLTEYVKTHMSTHEQFLPCIK